MRFLKILVLILSMVTLVGVGHQVLIILPMEAITVMLLLDGDFDFNVTGDYEARIWTISLVTFAAQVFLLLSFFLPQKLKNIFSIVSGVIFLLSVLLMINGFGQWNPDAFYLIVSLPLLITVCLLLTKEIRAMKTGL